MWPVQDQDQAFGDRIHALRLARDWTLREAGMHLGLAFSRIAHYERGKWSKPSKPPVPPYQTVIRMARVYGASEEELLRLAGYGSSVDLTDDELALVRGYRRFTADGRRRLMACLQEIDASEALPPADRPGEEPTPAPG